ncbi:inositol monophosphatase family protein [Lederbergia galactosidilytica]|uniref:inositol monophosphatase family protein n=1 Tax=Lederbergia galactosidilytica TaxID=217031 RepID=UPI000AB36943|nr:inositol monophosphatase family protein [Lederbergia galactosidilytica]MBP1913790.1 myo-inositol-1(or 4)-monophosphatase [Lederbergia galactosidilytica]
MAIWTEVDKTVKQWLKETRVSILEALEHTLNIDTKSNANDLVTNVDKETEQFFVSRIKEHYPQHKIVGEEGFGDEVHELEGIVWIIDPIDGTMNFVHQKRNFFISIGILEDGIGKLGYLYDVILDELYCASKGEGAFLNDKVLPPLQQGNIEEAIIGFNPASIHSEDAASTFIPLLKDVRGARSYGSAAMEFAYVATGRMDAYISKGLSPWDFAGGKIIVEELGGIVTDLRGNPVNLLERSSILVARPGLHKKLCRYFQS